MQFTHEAAIVMDASPRDVYSHWADIRALPQRLSHLRATATTPDADDIARLVIVLDGRHIEFSAQRTMCDDHTLCWQSLGDHFLYLLTIALAPHDDGQTYVTVTVAYDPPGFLPDIAESLGRRKLFKRALDADLRRYADFCRHPKLSGLALATD